MMEADPSGLESLSALRTWPPGCGPRHARRGAGLGVWKLIHGRGARANRALYSGLRTWPPGCGPRANRVGAEGLVKEKEVVEMKMFPRRMVSAVRTFPGRNLSCSSEEADVEKESVSTANSSVGNELIERRTVKFALNGVKSDSEGPAMKKLKQENEYDRFALKKEMVHGKGKGALLSDRLAPAFDQKKNVGEKRKPPLQLSKSGFELAKKTDQGELDGVCSDFALLSKSRDLGVVLPRSFSFGRGNNSEEVTRSKVRETLRLFQAVCRKLLQEDEANLKEGGPHIRRIDFRASAILRENHKFVNQVKIIGPVPGVEVGDEFHYRMELNIIGVHRPSQGGIDYLGKGDQALATSIVTSGGYNDETDYSDELIYSGSGGNVMNVNKEPVDQKLERGNLALKNSVLVKNPVRVIRVESSIDGKTRKYIYDGLYLVEKYWHETGPHGKLVYKFKLVRMPHQPKIAWKVLKKSRKVKREGLCINDISRGKEPMPICALNSINNERPPLFNYVVRMKYPDWFRLIPPKGCDCEHGCRESEKCSCITKNGGEFPYNHNGAIVRAKPLVYECGPLCRCPPSCYNRVTQHGIKLQLEIFKTEMRGWGVRSLTSIPSGSFICEYVGELLEEGEAEQRTGNDEYLFDIGNQYNDDSLWSSLSTLMFKDPNGASPSCTNDGRMSSIQATVDGCFTIDAAQCGNVSRFINHSCSPNLYAQNVLYDHWDRRVPHIMLFAAENIPPLQELTYHYNYKLDQVFDSDGNVKKKACYCGSSECTGRMY